MPLIIDSETKKDLQIDDFENSESVFSRLNFTQTTGGRKYLRQIFSSPSNDADTIYSAQAKISAIGQVVDQWPKYIGNGTMLVMEKFCTEPYSGYSPGDGLITRMIFSLINADSYYILKFSTKVFADFLRGLDALSQALNNKTIESSCLTFKEKIDNLLNEKPMRMFASLSKNHQFTSKDNFYYGYYIRVVYKKQIVELIDLYCQMEAWYSLAVSMNKYGLVFPEFVTGSGPEFEAKGLYHFMVKDAKGYDISLSEQQSLIFLTGSNMAGKSTLIKTIGLSLFLAHIGLGVPARSLKLSLFDGLSTNINVEDDLTHGQSYFFNEVKRINQTVNKVSDGSRWMILIDEIFKGTNIVDSMKCSIDVIDGFSRVKSSLFVISSHLYEIANEFKYPDDIACKYLETILEGDEFHFTYQLKNGVSSERIGHTLMRREDVVQKLLQLQMNTG